MNAYNSSSTFVIRTALSFGLLLALPAMAQGQKTVKVKKTIVISKAGVYDFKNVLHVWTGKGKCDQGEAQPAILHITADNVTVKNFRWEKAPDGVHVYRKERGVPIRNVKLISFKGQACEDAMTIRGVDVEVSDSELRANPNTKYQDKTVAANSSKNLLFKRVRFIGGKTCIRFKSGADIRVEDSSFEGCDTPAFGDTTHDSPNYDPPGRPARYSSENTTYKDCKKGFRAGDSKVSLSSGAGDQWINCRK